MQRLTLVSYQQISIVQNIHINNLSFNYNFLVFIQSAKMASRYNQEYLFQHSLMSVPFTNLNDIIIHLNPENIPESLCHFVSAVFINGSYWNDTTKIQRDLEIECQSTNYNLTYLSYISMMKASYNL